MAIWTLTASGFLPTTLLAELDGLVLAGSGSGRCGGCGLLPGLVSVGPPLLRRLLGLCAVPGRRQKRFPCRACPAQAGPTAPRSSCLACSVPQAVVDQLSPAWTARLPIVICSRCGVGANCDDWLYRGSLEKYASRGFVLDRGYQHLNPLQARSLLLLRLAAFGQA